jgi:hypothetical protein
VTVFLFTKELFNVPQNDNYYKSSIVSAARLLNGLITRRNGKSRMISLVDARFAEWTSGLDTRESMISIFSHIRDIPYSFVVSNPDPKTSPEQLLKAGKGSCGPKHHLLAEMYRKLNLCVVFATIAFSWNDPDLLYPSELRKQAVRLPAAYHLACRVQIGCRWILVDATWDLPLGKAGFPVNERWDGYSEMRCGVKPFNSLVKTAFCPNLKNEPCKVKKNPGLCPTEGEKDHWDSEDQARYYCEIIAERTPDEVEQIALFYRDFEDWLVEVRQQKFEP